MTDAAATPATILVVDDSPTTIDLLVRILEDAGFEVAAADNGRSALDLVPRLRPDLILMDVAMPVMDGFQACRILKNDTQFQAIPVIFITARTDIGDLSRGYQVGGVDYIRKPFQKEEVILRIRAQLDLRRLNSELTHRNEQLAAILGNIMEGTLVIDCRGRISNANPAALQQLGYELPELIGRPLTELAPGLAGPWADSPLSGDCGAGDEFHSRAYSLQRKDDGPLPVELHATNLLGSAGDCIGGLIAFRDIAPEQESERRLLSLLSTDHLTGLVNWKRFSERLSAALDAHRSDPGEVAVLLLDLDDFRDINDTYGHDLGDRLLTVVADRLCEHFSDDTLVTRLGGDEFALLLDSKHCSDQPQRLAAELLNTLSVPFPVSDNRIYLGASIGIATSSVVDLSAQEMIRAADVALSRAKELGKNRYVLFTMDMQQRIVERSRVTAKLREGIAGNEFSPYFQPLVDARSGRVVGAEALLRWRRKDQVFSAGRFIEAAEHSGLIDEIGLQVLNAACREAAAWQTTDKPPYVSVNVSAHQLRHADFFDHLVAALDNTHLPPESLVLELTESTLMQDPERALDFLGRVRKLGVRLAIDDFGTGYSSLNHLSRLPVDILKIDRSFIDKLNKNPTDTALVVAIIDIAKLLGLEVVAEGVEDETQREFLTAKGCDILQGFLLARPLPSAEFIALLERSAPPDA